MTLPLLTGDRVSSVNRRLESAIAIQRSPFTGQDTSQDWGGRWWAYDIQLGPWRDPRSKRATAAFFTGLAATAGRFLFADPTAPYLGGYTALGSPTISGASQTGRFIVTAGWLPHVVLRAGMCLSFSDGLGTRMHMLIEDTTVNALGGAVLTLSPGVRNAPASGAAIEYLAPKVQLRVPSAVATSIATGGYTTFTFTAEETL